MGLIAPENWGGGGGGGGHEGHVEYLVASIFFTEFFI